MFCPSCGAEYREGFEVCADCGVDLVDALPEEEVKGRVPRLGPDAETVFETGDPSELAVVESLLESAGIEHLTLGAGLQELFGVGRLGLGFNPIVGPLRVSVRAEEAERAREVLAARAAVDDLPPEPG